MTPRHLAAFAGFFSLGTALFLLFQPFHSHIPAFLVLYSLLCAGIALLARRVRRLSTPQTLCDFRADAVTVLVGALVMRALLLTTVPTLSDDVYRYLWDGRVQKAGVNPYLYPPASAELSSLRDDRHALINHPSLGTPYPPLAQLSFRGAVAWSPTITAQKALSVIFDLAGIVLLLALLRQRGKPAAWAALYAWHPLPVVEFAGSGHIDSLMLALWLGAIFLYARGRTAASGVWFGLSMMAKWIPVVMTPWLLRRGHAKAFVLFVLTIGVFCSIFMPGLATFFQSYGSSGAGGTADWVFNAGLYSALSVVVGDPTLRKGILALALVTFAFWWAHRKDDPAAYAFGVLFALLLASPVVYPWYVVWLLPFATLLGSTVAFLWAFLVAFSYVVHIRYVSTGMWALPTWVPCVEYTVLYTALLIISLRRLRRPRPPRRPSVAIPSPRVAVIIPALNEEKAIGLVIEAIPRTFVRDIIVVDNGSRDATVEVARNAGARVVQETRKGYGSAVARGLGMLTADIDVVVILDGDNADFPEELPALLRPIQDGTADLVMGNRTVAALPGSLMPQQRFGNWLTCFLIDFLYGHRFQDMGPFRAIRREALDEMNMEDRSFGWNVEMQVKALRMGWGVVELPVRYRPRIGQSKISGTVKGTIKAGVVILWSIYRYAFPRAGDR